MNTITNRELEKGGLITADLAAFGHSIAPSRPAETIIGPPTSDENEPFTALRVKGVCDLELTA
jgi:hypothetical protein